jgi:hypothetical protein
MRGIADSRTAGFGGDEVAGVREDRAVERVRLEPVSKVGLTSGI